MRWKNRDQAGRQLAAKLSEYRGADVVVLGLPRGGVAVAVPVAEALGAPLDVLVARKIGAPGQPEFGIGAITSRGVQVLNDAVVRHMFLPPGYMALEGERQRQVALDRERRFHGDREALPLAGKTAIIVDDGIATGMTVMAAIADLRARPPASQPREIVVAAPVIAPDTEVRLLERADRVVALAVPDDFMAVGQYYDDFRQVEDEEVKAMLADAVRR